MHLKYFLPNFGIAKRLSGRRDPFNDFKREINTLIDRAFSGYAVPEIGHGDLNIDVYDKGQELEIKVELPGVAEDDINISVQDNNIIISGEKKSENKQEKKNYYMLERVYGSFMRSIPLPFKINGDKVCAEMDKGVLTICVPKPKKIENAAKVIKVKKPK